MYTDELNAQVVLALLKAHGISTIVASPGTTNIPIIGSAQSDHFFTMYSVVDERSAAYVAIGLSSSLGIPVVLSCTGATASRNYMSALTEAYYRKLPLIAITSLPDYDEIGQLLPQVIDRTTVPNDIVRFSVQLPTLQPGDDYDRCAFLVNQALLEAKRHGGGPVHINLSTTHSGSFSSPRLPSVPVIERFTVSDLMENVAVPSPQILMDHRVVVFVGSHQTFSPRLSAAIEMFSGVFDAPVLVDQTSGYRGPVAILSSYLASTHSMTDLQSEGLLPEVIIHIGEVSGDYPTMGLLSASGAITWRISEDGELRNRFGDLKYVFECPEHLVLEHYARRGQELAGERQKSQFCSIWISANDQRGDTTALPLSATYIASVMSKKLPHGSALHLSILNTLRNWNFFDVDPSIMVTANVGGFGIDGPVSTLLGTCLAFPDRLCIGVIGDLAFFYDMNALGNRHVPPTMRILLVNNGLGAEFKLSSHIATNMNGNEDSFVAATGHFGSAKAWATSMGFRYMTASTKKDFESQVTDFLDADYEKSSMPILFEVFTLPEDESVALEEFTRRNDSHAMVTLFAKILPQNLRKPLKRLYLWLRRKIASIIPH